MKTIEQQREANRKSYWKHREKRLKKYREYDRTVKLFKRYGITPEQWEEMYSRQQGCCEICGIHQSQLKIRLSVDHDHKNGNIRGLLCASCNAKLATVEDIHFLEAAQEYLKNGG